MSDWARRRWFAGRFVGPFVTLGVCWVAAAFPGTGHWVSGAAAAEPQSSDKQPVGHEDEPQAHDSARAPAMLIRVPLPIEGEVDDRAIAEIRKRITEFERSEQRPIVVVEFQARDDERSSKSRFEDALALARFLAGPQLRRVRTVAYVPHAVTGHAVLPVIACERIIIGPDASVGAAGIAESSLDPTVRRAYAEIAERRRTIPAPVALAMLDPDVAAYEVELADGSQRFVLDADLKELRASGRVIREQELGQPGTPLILDAQALESRYGFASHRADSLAELAVALGVAPSDLRDDPSKARKWHAVRLSLQQVIDAGAARRAIRRVESARRTNPDIDLLVVLIDSSGGEPAATMDLAHYFADQVQLRTVAVVVHEARSVAALVALACDECYVAREAVLGGEGSVAISEGQLKDLRESVIDLAHKREVDWSLLMALVDPKLAVFRYRRVNGIGERYLCNDEHESLADADRWERGDAIDMGTDGISGEQAVSLGLARGLTSGLAEIRQRYGIQEEIQEAQGQWIIEAIQSLGSEPWFARALLFIAFFALMSELSSPGLGVAGFISATCFMLFFWAAFLNGTAGWLEVVLFLGGAIFLAAEFFLLPGFGVFGVGGTAMILASIILASQTFIIPHNSYQVRILSRSLWLVAAAGGGVLGGLWVMAHYLHRVPMLNRMMLRPPSEEEIEIQRQRELPVDWRHLVGQTGVALTPLVPAGKAQFGQEIVNVISEGDLVEKGESITVTEVVGNRVVVARSDDTAV